MESGGLIPHSQGISNNPYPGPNQHIDTYLFKINSVIFSQLSLGLPIRLFHAGIPVKTLKALLPSPVLISRFNCPDFIR